MHHTIYVVHFLSRRFITSFESCTIPEAGSEIIVDGEDYIIAADKPKWTIRNARGGVFEVELITIMAGKPGE